MTENYLAEKRRGMKQLMLIPSVLAVMSVLLLVVYGIYVFRGTWLFGSLAVIGFAAAYKDYKAYVGRAEELSEILDNTSSDTLICGDCYYSDTEGERWFVSFYEPAAVKLSEITDFKLLLPIGVRSNKARFLPVLLTLKDGGRKRIFCRTQHPSEAAERLSVFLKRYRVNGE